MTWLSSETVSSAFNRKFWIGVLVVVTIAAALRLYKLGSYPQVFNQDEATLGYDAWSLWNTGRDQHGELLPVYFRTFNDYVPPVAYYIAAPFVGLLGLSETTSRLPFALMGIGTVLLVALLGRRWFSPAAGVLAALFLAVDPWHVNYSRIAFPASCIPFFTAAALYTFTVALSRIRNDEEASPAVAPSERANARRWPILVWLSLSGLCFGLLTDCYPTMKVQGPLLFGICLLAALPILWRRRWLAAYLIFVYLLVMNPLLVRQALDWNNVQARFNGISSFDRPDWFGQFARLYADHYVSGGLFINGFSGGVAVIPQGIGELFWPEGLLWLVAVVGLARRQFRPKLGFGLILLLAVWFFTFPLADCLSSGDGATATTFGRPHEIRSYSFLPLPELLAGLGAGVLWQWSKEKLSKYRWKNLSAAYLPVAAGAGLLLVFLAIFLPYYFAPPYSESPDRYTTTPYLVGLRPILETVNQNATPCDVVWMDGTTQTYIFYLFVMRYPPAQFQAFSISHRPLDSYVVGSVDQVRFHPPDLTGSYKLVPAACQDKSPRILYVTRFRSGLPGWQTLASFNNTAGQAIWAILSTKMPYPDLI